MSVASQTSLVGAGCGNRETTSDSLSATVETLTRDVESHKVVIDLRNAEISQLKQANTELQKQVTDFAGMT